MSITSITYVTVTCDHCEVVFDKDDSGYPVHFDLVTDAIEYLTKQGWLITSTGRHLCNRCRVNEFCNCHSHRWGPWILCRCQGQIPDHAEHGCGLFRICLYDGCNRHDDTSLANLPTIDEHTTFGR